MQSYLSGRGANIGDGKSDDPSGSFSSYLADPAKQHSISSPPESESEEVAEKEVIHTDESGIKIEVVSVDGTPTNLLVHIPDGRVIDLSCEY
jgi:hypothetical protein